MCDKTVICCSICDDYVMVNSNKELPLCDVCSYNNDCCDCIVGYVYINVIDGEITSVGAVYGIRRLINMLIAVSLIKYIKGWE